MSSDVNEQLKARREAALHFHEFPKPGKLEIQPDQAARQPARPGARLFARRRRPLRGDRRRSGRWCSRYTSRGNLVAVISNGTAVLGLGAIGALASKPVMEGKAVLFKKFAGIDVFDIEIERDPKKFIEVVVVAALEPTFGGINLEDIKAPECFEIEEALRERMPIPVFHDDQHGTAIIVGAAVLNGLELSGKKIDEVKICASGAGAAAIACLNILLAMGAKLENIWVADKDGLLTYRRNDVNDKWRGKFCRHDSEATSLAEVIDGADIFLGLSAAGALKPEMLKKMARDPLVLALANPNPEIMPEEAKAVRPDAMVCTGRSDYPNQVNNVLCFPFIFRGALDVGATQINEEMKLAASYAIARLAHDPGLEVSPTGQPAVFGPEHIIPNPFDQRLILRIAPAVAKAAMATGVAKRPIADFDAYHDSLNRFVFRSGLVMKPIIDRAQGQNKRIVFADGEDERVLRAAQVLIEEGIARPILIGRPAVLESRIERFGLNLKPGRDFEVVNPEDDPRYRDYVTLFHSLVGRSGVTPETARTIVRTNTTDDRCAGGEARRCRCDAVRPAGPLHQARPRHPLGDRHAGRRARRVGAQHADHAARCVLPHRHLCQHRPDGRRTGIDRPPGTQPSQALQYRSPDRAAQLFELRLARRRHGVQDARGLSQAQGLGARHDRRRRNAGRPRAQ